MSVNSEFRGHTNVTNIIYNNILAYKRTGGYAYTKAQENNTELRRRCQTHTYTNMCAHTRIALKDRPVYAIDLIGLRPIALIIAH